MPFSGKRIDDLVERRSSQRESVVLPASILALERSCCATVENLSEAGACLRGCTDFKPDDHLWLRVGCLDRLVTVAWCEGDRCGVTFDGPLGHDDLIHLRCEGRNTLVTCLAPDEKLAAQDWIDGRS